MYELSIFYEILACAHYNIQNFHAISATVIKHFLKNSAILKQLSSLFRLVANHIE